MSDRESFYHRYPAEEFADTITLPTNEYGLLQRLRDYSWYHQGIPDDEKTFLRLGKVFQVSRYRMNKMWKEIENFFALRDGFYVYEPDEKKRTEILETSHRRQKAGKLGAQARWSGRVVPISGPAIGADGNAILPAIESHLASDVLSGGGGGLPSLDSNTENPPPPTPAPNHHAAIAAHCKSLGISPPGRTLTEQLRKKFSGHSPEMLVARLPLFQGQTSPGLWAHKTWQELVSESERQAVESAKKPPQPEAERRQRMLDLLEARTK